MLILDQDSDRSPTSELRIVEKSCRIFRKVQKNLKQLYLLIGFPPLCKKNHAKAYRYSVICSCFDFGNNIMYLEGSRSETMDIPLNLYGRIYHALQHKTPLLSADLTIMVEACEVKTCIQCGGSGSSRIDRIHLNQK
jgi:hypothetical protein